MKTTAKPDILMVGSFNPMALENYYAYHLSRLGHQVCECETSMGFRDGLSTIVGKVKNKVFSDQIAGRINKKVVEECHKHRPDIVLIFKGADITPDTLGKLKEQGPILVNYNPDHPLFFERENSFSRNIRQGIPFYDLYLTYTENIVRQLQMTFEVEAQCLPFGFNERLKVNPSVQSEDEVLFVGHWDQNRTRWLSQVPEEIPLTIYGNHDWHLRQLHNPVIRRRFRKQYLVGQEYADHACAGTAVINLLRAQNLREQSHNMRTFEVPGYGGLLLAQRTEEQMTLFEENTEAVYFDTPEEMNDHLKFLKEKPSLVKKIKAKARERSLKSGYTYQNRAIQLSDMLVALVDKVN